MIHESVTTCRDSCVCGPGEIHTLSKRHASASLPSSSTPNHAPAPTLSHTCHLITISATFTPRYHIGRLLTEENLLQRANRFSMGFKAASEVCRDSVLDQTSFLVLAVAESSLLLRPKLLGMVLVRLRSRSCLSPTVNSWAMLMMTEA